MSDQLERKNKLDAASGAVIQRAVAVGLRQRLAPDTSPVPAALQCLLDELHRQDAAENNHKLS